MSRRFVLLTALAVGLLSLGSPASAKPKKEKKAERYPPSFRLKVQESIERGVHVLKNMQNAKHGWGNLEDRHGLGHSALPVLALLKAGVAPDDEQLVRAFKVLRTLPKKTTYSVGCYLMALHAKYAPKIDTFDTDIDTARAKRVDPDDVRKRMSVADRAEVDACLEMLLLSQTARGLWHYEIPADKKVVSWDLSCTQYAVLGLRAAADCGAKVPRAVWQDALRALIPTQYDDGEDVKLFEREVRDGYVFLNKVRAKARGFAYKDGRTDGPKGEKTVRAQPQTGAMTTAGIACVAVCREGLWRSRKFSGRDRKASAYSIRDAKAWLQVNFKVDDNPGRDGYHKLYYLYGLERMGMLTDTRWIGAHDWYFEGATHLMGLQNERGSWGNHTANAFAILFLKRATSPASKVVTTD